jgi:aminoglycoside 3-N-acetyltransferase
MINLLPRISKSKYVLIFSDFSRNVYSKKKIDKMLNNSKNMVKSLIKKDYTVIIPTYNFNFPNDKVTSNSTEHITSGYFAKYLIKNFNFKRTNKPMYNYAVIGGGSKSIINLKQSTAWGENSIMSYLSKQNAIGIGINIDIENFGWVAIHCAEEKFKVPYRYYKKFKGTNLDSKKKVFEKLFVRNLNQKLTTNPNKLYKKLMPKIKQINKTHYKIYMINMNNAYNESCMFLSKDLYSLTINEKN